MDQFVRMLVVCPRAPERVARLRRAGVAHLRRWGIGGSVVDTVELLISELTTNAVRYGRGESIDLSVTYREGVVRIEVWDGSSGLPSVRRVGPEEESGRGMQLVVALADAWGTSGDGCRTWCMVRVGGLA